MKRLVVFTLVEVVVALLAAYGAHHWFKDVGRDILFGLGALLTLEIIQLKFVAHDSSRKLDRAAGILDALRAETPFSELVLLYGLGRMSVSGYDAVEVPRDQVREFWKACISRARGTWWAVSYVRGDEAWLMAWERWAQAIQQERLAGNCRIERLFVFDSDDERKQHEAVMREQASVGIAVRWLLKPQTESVPRIYELTNKVGGFDFGIADSSWVFTTRLGANREITGALATREEGVSTAAKDLSRELWDLAEGKKQVI